jgi:AcrR family transcriptional regulator
MSTATDTDPRIKRTRQLLFKALQELLAEKGFDAITMGDLAERSTLNRGTIYDHFADKFALLEAMVAEQFQQIFCARMGNASATCLGSVRQLILTVCDFLGALMSCCMEHQRPFEPVVESTVRTILRRFLLEGLKKGGKAKSQADAELRATAASWLICGTVFDWSRERKMAPDALADEVLPLVTGILYLGQA